MSKPLDGILVVALEQAVCAPYCSARLADAGARVIKIERAEGDFARHYDAAILGQSTHFIWLNRGKQSLVLNIKEAEDLNFLKTLLKEADIFIQNLAPGAIERTGLSYEDLRSQNPGLITCDINGYGDGHARATMPAYDLLVQAETGLCSLTGSADEAGRVGVSVCDISAGMNAYQNILEALIARSKDGKGRSIKISLFDSMADWMSVPFLYYEGSGQTPKRMGIRHPSIAPYGVFETKDAKTFVLSIQNEREWQRLCTKILNRPDWVESGFYKSAIERVQNRSKLDQDLQDLFHGFEAGPLCDLFMEHKIAFGRLNEISDLTQHPALKRMITQTPNGPVSLPCPPGKTAEDFKDQGPVPFIGEQSDSIRKEFGS